MGVTSVPGFLLRKSGIQVESLGTISSILVSVGGLEHFEKSRVHCLLTVVKAILNVGLRGRGGGKREGGGGGKGGGREGECEGDGRTDEEMKIVEGAEII